MLAGVVPFPPEFAARYRAKGYWRDRSLARGIRRGVRRNSGRRVALIDGDAALSPTPISTALTDNLALNLLELGLQAARSRGAARCPMSPNSCCSISRCRRSAASRSPRSATHRYSEISQFVRIAQAVGLRLSRAPERFRLRADGRARRQRESRASSSASCWARPRPGELSLTELIERPATLAQLGARRDQDRPDRSLHLPAFGRHHRRAEADPAHA